MAKRPFIYSQNVNEPYRDMVLEALKRTVPLPHASRSVSIRFEIIQYLYSQGVHYFVPVYYDSKEIGWQAPRLIPLHLQTIHNMLKERNTTEARTRFKRSQYKYDIAVRTGTWQMPYRLRDRVLIILDVDDWNQIPEYIKEILYCFPTFVMRTQRGLHFYFWVSRWFKKSFSLAGVADWQGMGRIAVVTGSHRQPMYMQDIAILDDYSAERIYNFIKYPRTPPPPTWTEEDIPGRYIPFKSEIEIFRYHETSIVGEGERNQFINTVLWSLRHRLSPDQLEAKAEDLATENCIPPYPLKDARAIARSISNKVRFQIRRYKPNFDPPEKEDYPVIRLARYYPKTGVRFTRFDYEKCLLSDGWKIGKRGRVEAAIQDIKVNVEKGVIHVVDKEKPGGQGGRPTLIYERVKDYDKPLDYVLPCKVTPRNLRLGIFMRLLPERRMAVARPLVRKYVHVTEQTITRYSNFLRNAEYWGGHLLAKQVRPPLILGDFLRRHTAKEWPIPRHKYYSWVEHCLIYQPSVYQRHAFYKEIMNRGYFPPTAAVPQWAGGMMRSLGINAIDMTNMLADPHAQRPGILPPRQRAMVSLGDALQRFAGRLKEKRQAVPQWLQERITNESGQVAPIVIESQPRDPNKLYKCYCESCRSSWRHKEKGAKLCPACVEKIEKVKTEREARTPDNKEWGEDYCHFCHRIFPSREYPYRAVCASCERQHFADTAPVRPLYCPNHKCGHKIYIKYYEDWMVPQDCPGCRWRIPKDGWRIKKPLPEDQLPGYPHNRYVDDKVTIFDLLSNHRDRNSEELKRYQYLITPECREEWRKYILSQFVDVECELCQESFHVYRRDVAKRKICPKCQRNSKAKLYPLPMEAVTALEECKKRQVGALNELFERFFNNPTKKPHDILFAVDEFGYDWVEWAIRAAHRKKKNRKKGEKRIYNYFPYIRRTLENWSKQGHPNAEDRRLGQEEAADERHFEQSKPDYYAKRLGPNPTIYREFDIRICTLTPYIAQELTIALVEYGKELVRIAIDKTWRANAYHWSYCKRMIDILAAEDGLVRFEQEDL